MRRAAGLEDLRPSLLGAMLAADRPAAESVIDAALRTGEDGVAIVDGLLAPVMREVGRLWEAGEASIADEHLATALGHTLLTRIYPSLVTAEPRSRGRVLLAGSTASSTCSACG